MNRGDGGLQSTAQHLFHGLAPSYDSVLEYVTLYQDRYWKKFLLEEADLKEGFKILDLACGTGVLEDYITKGDCEVVGLDVTERMIRIGKEKRRRAEANSLVVGDAESIPFGDESFDVVLSCYLPKYCRTDRMADEIQRVLKPGGRLLLYDFTRPRGFLAPFHAFYVYGVLKLLGVIAGVHRESWNSPSRSYRRSSGRVPGTRRYPRSCSAADSGGSGRGCSRAAS